MTESFSNIEVRIAQTAVHGRDGGRGFDHRAFKHQVELA